MTLRVVGAVSCALLIVGLGTSTRSTGAAVPPPSPPSPIVWFLTIQNRVGRVQTGAMTKIYDNPLHCTADEDDCNLRGIAATSGALWLPDANNGLRRIDPNTGRAANSINGSRYSSAPFAWDGRLWFTAVDRLLGVKPPSTGVVTTVTPSKTHVEDIASSPHFLWTVGSGSTRSTDAAVQRMDHTGHVQAIDLPVPDEVAPVIGALDDHTAYVVTSPGTDAPSRLFRIAITSGGARVNDLGALTFNPNAIVPIGDRLWLDDINGTRLVALNLDGRPVTQVNLDVPGDGHLIGAFGRLWYMGSSDTTGSELDIVDPAMGSVISNIHIPLPGDDRVGEFTVTQ